MKGLGDDPRLLAAIHFIGQTGAKNFQMRYSDDVEPLVWTADAEWKPGRLCGSGFTPAEAAMTLLHKVAVGGICAHCGRPSGVSDDWQHAPASAAICWFIFDPELVVFRRSCEGDTVGRAYGVNPDTGRIVGRNDPCPCGSGQKWKRCHGAGK